MRRVYIRALLGASIAVGAVAVVGTLQAGAQSEPPLAVKVTGFQILRQDTTEAEPTHAFVLRQGQRYQFRIHYDVSGARRIATGHTYTFTNVTTRQQVAVVSDSYDPEKSGSFNEYSARVIPADWEPGVYRIAWTLNAKSPGHTAASQDGETSFLLAGPIEP